MIPELIAISLGAGGADVVTWSSSRWMSFESRVGDGPGDKNGGSVPCTASYPFHESLSTKIPSPDGLKGTRRPGTVAVAAKDGMIDIATSREYVGKGGRYGEL